MAEYTTKLFRIFIFTCCFLTVGILNNSLFSSNINKNVDNLFIKCPAVSNLITHSKISANDFLVRPIAVMDRDSIRRKDTTKRNDTNSSGSSNSGNSLSNWNIPSDPRAFLVVGVVLLSVAAIVVSNDVSVHRTCSFSHPAPHYSNNFGLSFALRKTFDHSALEYGGTYLKFYDYFNPNPNISLKELQVWGGHLNFVHQIFYKQTPDRLRFYIGPSVNFSQHLSGTGKEYTMGVGGITGVQYRLLDRLKLDFRYDYTTQSNQLQAGFFFTYQKKTPWETED